MTTLTGITLRVFAAALLIIAGMKLMLAMVSSFQAERASQSDGGYQIDHVIEINHWTVVLGLVGGLMLILSFLGRRAPA
jgi:hypothetical protein